MQKIALKGRRYIPLRAKSYKKHKIRMDKTTSNPWKEFGISMVKNWLMVYFYVKLDLIKRKPLSWLFRKLLIPLH